MSRIFVVEPVTSLQPKIFLVSFLKGNEGCLLMVPKTKRIGQKQ